MRLAQIFILCLALVGVALGLSGYKVFYLHFPLQPNQNAHSWIIEAKIRFRPVAGTPVQLAFFTPQGTSALAKVNDNIIASQYGIERRIGKDTGNQRMILTRRDAKGRQTIFYRAIFYELKSSDRTENDKTKPKMVPVVTPSALLTDDVNDPAHIALYTLIDEAKQKSVDPASLVLELVKLMQQSVVQPDDRITVLQSSLKKPASLAELVNMAVNAANIPARLVTGVDLHEKQHGLPFMQWLEFYQVDHQADHWVNVDIANGKLGISANYLPWWRGDQHVINTTGMTDVSIDMSAKYNREDAITQAMWKTKNAAKWITNVSLLELPIDTQLMFNIVLMIPIGAFIIVILRQLVGIPTFGTFMPVLMALSFRETGLLWGIGLFALIVLIGLFLRAYFEELRLLVVPRLAAVLTIVVMLIAALTVILYRFGINAGLSITLFPMIILTMTIERMALLTEEFGAASARKTAYGTIVAASIAYVVMHNAVIEHLIFLFPELLLIVLAGCILLGRYNGYKASEYLRFRKLVKAMKEGHDAGAV